MPGAAPLAKRKARRRSFNFDTPLRRAMLQVLAVVLFFALWEIGVRMGWISAFLVGSPAGIFSFAAKMIASGELLSDTWYTLFEAILGFVIGTIFGSLLGLVTISALNFYGASLTLLSVADTLKPLRCTAAKRLASVAAAVIALTKGSSRVFTATPAD